MYKLKKKYMKIELKNVKFSESQSDETNAFTADIWVDGKKCGYCKNNGCGGETETHGFYDGKSTTMLDLFRKTEEHCKNLPDHTWEYEGKTYSMKNSLESVVDELFEDWLKNREKKKMEKKWKTMLCGVFRTDILTRWLSSLNR